MGGAFDGTETMSDDRRYSEDEIRRIFDDASRAQEEEGTRLPAEGGMTLDELRRIGSEVGIRPEHVERAARSLDTPEESGRERLLGLPIGVGRSVELERRLTDEEWEALVIDLRQTFDAKGHLSASGSFRQWTNGNLQALLEPAGDTHRLRLRTTKGSSRALMTAGGIMGAVALIMAVLAFFAAGDLEGAMELGLISVVLMAGGALQLPGWAATRERQMEAVAERALLMSAESQPGIPKSPADG
jgi:hypothetical protein